VNVCIATHDYPPFTSGVSTYYASLAALLAERGHRVTVLTPGHGRHGDVVENGVRVVALLPEQRRWERRLLPILGRDQAAVVESLAMGLSMRGWLTDHAEAMAVDIIETVDFLGFGGLLLAPELPAVVATGHGAVAQAYQHEPHQDTACSRTLRSLEVTTMALADAVIGSSPANTEDWARYLGRDVRFVTAPWPTAPVPAAGPRPAATARQSASGLQGLVVGRLQSWKGPDLALAALRDSRAQGAELRLTWVGADTRTAPGCRSMAETLRRDHGELWDRAFTWIPHAERDRVLKLQREADFVLVPSRWDTFNYTAVEAMTAGQAVIISDGAGASYFCRHEHDSLVVPGNDAGALRDAMLRLARDPTLRRRLAGAAPATVRDEFTVANMVDAREAVYAQARERHQYRRQWPYAPAGLLGLLQPVLAWAEHPRLLRRQLRLWSERVKAGVPAGLKHALRRGRRRSS